MFIALSFENQRREHKVDDIIRNTIKDGNTHSKHGHFDPESEKVWHQIGILQRVLQLVGVEHKDSMNGKTDANDKAHHHIKVENLHATGPRLAV